MRDIDKIIIHCSATRAGLDVGAKEIRQWHTRKKPNGNGWSDIGYHYVIRRSGITEAGRPVERSGAHTRGHNRNSIGICLIGGVDDNKMPEDNFTMSQWDALENMICFLRESYPDASIHGHNEFSSKACPSFDVRKWVDKLDG